jgi:hypothetical protein
MQESALSTIGRIVLLLVISPAQTMVERRAVDNDAWPKAAAGQLGRHIDNGSTAKKE